MFRLILCMIFVCLCLSVGRAQDVRVQLATDEPPHYVGVPAIVQLSIDGLDVEPEPKCEIVDLADGLRISQPIIQPEFTRRAFRSGGRLQVVEQVTYTIQFRITAEEAGDYEVGPFLITQGNTEKRVDPIDMTFQTVPETDMMQIKLIMPETAYPNQRVPVQIEWWFSGELENLNELSIYSELFEKFTFTRDPQVSRRGSQMPLQTEAGKIALSATARTETVDGQEFTVLMAERTLVPDRPGKFELPPIVATIKYVTQWQRQRGGGFGSLIDDMLSSRRRAAKTKRFRAEGQPLSFEVIPFPTKDKPESFTGTVGKGFTLDVAADRTVVRTGDPIRLTIRLRGDGNIKDASLPVLSADGGLDPAKFRLPDSDIAGAFSEGAKEFVVSVRVQDENVNEIPSIAYSWFDTDAGKYLTTRSDPIALRVNPTEMVGVDSVVSLQPNATPSEEDPSGSVAETSRRAKSYSLTGADLAIEPDPAKLLTRHEGLLGRSSVQALGYGAGALLMFVAFFDQRRRQVDPEQRRVSQSLRNQRDRISAATGLPAKEASRQISDALRNVAAEFPNADRSSIQSIMSDCDALAYQPENSQSKPIDPQLVERALHAINELSQRVTA